MNFSDGQRVTVTRPGREPFKGTVDHPYTAPGYVAIRDDRWGGIQAYPANFVALIETEEPANAS